MLRKLIPILLALCSIASASVTMTATLSDGQGNTSKTGYLHFQLVNCGANVPIDSLSPLVVVQTQFDLRPATIGGSISGVVLSNEEIKCGGVASTQWSITLMKDQTHPLRDALNYVICDVSSTRSDCSNVGGGNFDLSTAIPTTTGPVSPGLVPVFKNSTGSQTWLQPPSTTGFFQGNFDFSGATVTGLNVAASIFPNCTTGSGSFALYTSATGINCEHFAGSDFHGNVFGQSFTAQGSNNGALFVVGGLPDPSIGSFPLQTFGWLARPFFTSSYFCRVPNTPAGAADVGKVLSLLSWDSVNKICDTGWVAQTGGSGGSPGPPVNSVQYNNSGAFAGDSTFTFNTATKQLTVPNVNAVRYVQSYNWSQAPTSPTSLAIGANTVTLAPCPLGIDVSNTAGIPYYVYVATTGTAEAVHVTGGTCSPGAASGTIIFTAVNTHSAGYSVASASGGLQEASNDAGTPNSMVKIAPVGANVNAIAINAPTYLHNNKAVYDLSGSLFSCSTRSKCIHIGDDVSSNDFGNITLIGPRLQSTVNVPGVHVVSYSVTSNVITFTTDNPHNFSMTANAGGPDVVWVEFYAVDGTAQHRYYTISSIPSSTTFSAAFTNANVATTSAFGWTNLEDAAIEDNALPAKIQNPIPQNSTGAFDNFLVIDNDQAYDISDFNVAAASLRCDATWCGSAILMRGDQGNASTGVVHDSNLSMSCNGNAITNYSGNGLSVNNSVIQAYAQYGVKYGSGLQGANLNNNYFEIGNCTNPYYPGSLQAEAGFIGQGQALALKGSFSAGAPAADWPQFANTGSNQRTYWIVENKIGTGQSSPMYAGYATTNGTGTVNLYWPQPIGFRPGTDTFDILLTTCVPGTLAPSICVTPNASATAQSVATAVSGSCSNGLCTYADTQGATSNYTVASNSAQAFGLWFWPASVLLASDVDSSTPDRAGFLITDSLPIGIQASTDATWVFADQCGSNNANFNPMIVSCLNTVGTYANWSQTILGSSPISPEAANSIGRLIFLHQINEQAPGNDIEIVTLNPADPYTLKATTGRGTGNLKDAYIGDDGNSAQPGNQDFFRFAFNTGASGGYDYCFAQTPSNCKTNFTRRLTNSLDLLKVPSQITEATFASLSAAIPCNSGAAGTRRPVSDSTVISAGTTITGGGTNHVEAYCNGTNYVVGEGGTAGSGTPGGLTTQVQYNNAGAFAGDSALTWDSTNKILTIGNTQIGGTGTAGNFWQCKEGTDPAKNGAGLDTFWCSSSSHRMMLSNNNLTAQQAVVAGADINNSDQVQQIHESKTSVNNAASPYTVLASDSLIRCDATAGAVTINLPAATATLRQLEVKKIDSSANACTVTRNGTDTIDGATTVVLNVQYATSRIYDAASGLWDRLHQSILGGDLSGVPSNAKVTKINGTSFSGTTGDLVSFGVSNTPADAGFLATNVVRKDAANTMGASSTIDLSATAVGSGLRLPVGAGAAPTTQGQFAFDSTTNGLRCGNGSTTLRCMQYSLISSGAATTENASTTGFTKITAGAGVGSTEISVRQMLPLAGTITNLCVTTTSTQSGTGSLVFTIKDSTAGSSAGSLTVTFAASATAQTICDNTNSDSVTAQHDYVIQVQNNATAASATVEGISAVYSY